LEFSNFHLATSANYQCWRNLSNKVGLVFAINENSFQLPVSSGSVSFLLCHKMSSTNLNARVAKEEKEDRVNEGQQTTPEPDNVRPTSFNLSLPESGEIASQAPSPDVENQSESSANHQEKEDRGQVTEDQQTTSEPISTEHPETYSPNNMSPTSSNLNLPNSGEIVTQAPTPDVESQPLSNAELPNVVAMELVCW
jgi:hypothetical protein